MQDIDDAVIRRAADSVFDDRGHWRMDVGRWSRPDESLEQDQFWQVLAGCVERLPPRLSRLFVLREIDGLSSDEICEVLNISTTNNLWVMLSRMRLRLRNCLDTHWFGKEGG